MESTQNGCKDLPEMQKRKVGHSTRKQETNGDCMQGEQRMKKPIDQILPNPHRNFDIYPISESQVERLVESIHEVGMFLGLPARKTSAGC